MSEQRNENIIKVIKEALGSDAKYFEITPDLENVLVDEEDHYSITVTFKPILCHPELKIIGHPDWLEFSIYDDDVVHTYGDGEDCPVTGKSIYSFLYWGLATTDA